MQIRSRALLFICCFMVSHVLLHADLVSGDLTPARFESLHRQLQPSPDETWRTVPWKIDLLDAQRTAAKEQKPIFIWAMDGHPLGCT